MTSLYLAGPMTGIPKFNFPAFDAAAAELRDQGFEIVSPAELDDPETREAALASVDGAPGSGAAGGESYGDFLSRDVRIVIDKVDGVATLGGWMGSRGARVEVFTAAVMGKPVYVYEEARLRRYSARALRSLLVGTLVPDDDYEATREPGHIHAELREEAPRPIQELSGHALPDGEERITSATGGQKGTKLCAVGDLDPEALMEVGKVAGFGARKYARLNYTKGFAWSLAFNALMRHALLFWSGEDTDEESELPHMAHAAWQCLCLLSFAEHLRGTDDRHINYYMEGEPRELES